MIVIFEMPFSICLSLGNAFKLATATLIEQVTSISYAMSKLARPSARTSTVIYLVPFAINRKSEYLQYN